MQIIADVFSSLSLGQSQTAGKLTFIPFVAADAAGDPGYLLLEEALDKGLAHVTEISEAGSVPELRFDNPSGHKVLLVDGDVLAGARQNRTVNLTLLVPAQTQLKIPVSCVEQGRWHYREREFRADRHNLYARARREKMQAVTENLRVADSRRSDQSALWENIAETAAYLRVGSATGSVGDVYLDQAERLEACVSQLRCDATHRGGVFLVDGRVTGLELFDCAASFNKCFPRLVESYALDALLEQAHPALSVAPDIGAWLADIVAARSESFKALGEGEDVRLTGEDLTGAALVADGRLVHLSVFALDGDTGRSRRRARLDA